MFSSILNKCAVIIIAMLTVLSTAFILTPSSPGLAGRIRLWAFAITAAILYAILLLCTAHRISRQAKTKIINLSWCGSIVFHLSFFVILAGVLVSMGSRREGREIFTEKETIAFSDNNFLYAGQTPFRLKLNKFNSVFKDDKPVDYTCDFSVGYETSAGWKKTRDFAMKVNEPLIEQGVSFVFKRWGYSPRIVIRDNQTGKTICDYFIDLDEVPGGDTAQKVFSAFTDVPGSNLKLQLSFYPAKNPYVRAKLYSDSRVYADGIAALKESLHSDRLTLAFDDYNCWIGVAVINDRGENIVLAGFTAAVIGLVMRFFFMPKEQKTEK